MLPAGRQAGEAGPTGFWLHRQLTVLGIRNYVVCPTWLDERYGGVNNDRTDALELATRLDRFLAGNDKALAIVRLPTEAEGQKRARKRQRQQLREQRLSLAAQGRSLMLLHGIRETNHWWKPGRWEALTPKLPAWLVERLEVFGPLILVVDQAVRQLSRRIEPDAPLPKGMRSLTHENIQTEVADWTRFRNRRQAGSYAGLSGGVSASGHTAADLSIAKAGNRCMRTELVELSWRLLLFQPRYYLVQNWKHRIANLSLSRLSRHTARRPSGRQRRTPCHLGQVLTFHQVHRVVMLPSVLADLVDSDDVGVLEASRCLGLGVEAGDQFLARKRAGWEELQGYEPVQANLSRPVNHTHPTSADLLNQLIVAEPALSERAGWAAMATQRGCGFVLAFAHRGGRRFR